MCFRINFVVEFELFASEALTSLIFPEFVAEFELFASEALTSLLFPEFVAEFELFASEALTSLIFLSSWRNLSYLLPKL